MKRNLKRMCLSVLCVLFIGPVAFADHHYGMAGCGLGAMVFEDDPGKVQIVAATLNNLVVPQTSAITTGSSNCYESRKETAALYIEINKSALQKEIAQGSGETLAGLEEIYGCKNSEEFKSTLKTNFINIYPSKDIESKVTNENILKVIESNSRLRSCKVLS